MQNSHGNPVVLDVPVGRPGGEGAVFAVRDFPGLVAKIFHAPLTSEGEAKLRAQIKLASTALDQISAWPRDLLLDGGKVVGLLMPRIHGVPVHMIYRPADRLRSHPSLGWDGLVKLAANIAYAFDVLHQGAVVMGDVNESNIMVTKDGLVLLIDCDSYQVPAVGGGVHLCRVGTPMWMPPELHGCNLSTTRRVLNHDLFGLALMLFHVLFMGRHPFAAVPKDVNSHFADMALEEVMKAKIYAYKRGGRPDFTIPPAAVHPRIAGDHIESLFERAFLADVRPAASEWQQALRALKFQKCAHGHTFFVSASECPWCCVAKQYGLNATYFMGHAVAHHGLVGSSAASLKAQLAVKTKSTPVPPWLTTVVAKVLVLPVMDVDVMLQSYVVTGQPMREHARSSMPVAGMYIMVGGVLMAVLTGSVAKRDFSLPVFFGLAAAVGLIMCSQAGTIRPAFLAELERRRRHVEHCRASVNQIAEDIKRVADRVNQTLRQHTQGSQSTLIRLIGDADNALEVVRAKLSKDIEKIEVDAAALPMEERTLKKAAVRQSQLQEALEKVVLADRKITHIGEVRARRLQAYGIKTAWDYHIGGNVHGMGLGDSAIRSIIRGIEMSLVVKEDAPPTVRWVKWIADHMNVLSQALARRVEFVSAQWNEAQARRASAVAEHVLAAAARREQSRLDAMHAEGVKQIKTEHAKFLDALSRLAQAYADLLVAEHAAKVL